MILGLGHRRGVGKDTTAKIIKGLIGYERASFADNLYDIGKQLYEWAGFKDRLYYEENYEQKEVPLLNGRTPRDILIDIGMKMREVDENIWINPIINKDNVVITDVRFPNEFNQVKEKGVCIKIIRPGWPESNDVADSALKNESGWDYILVNNENLRDNVIQMLRFFELCK